MRVIHDKICVLEWRCCSSLGRLKHYLSTKTVFALTFWLIISGALSAFCFASEAFAHTTSIITSNSITLNIAAVGDSSDGMNDILHVTSTCPLGYTVTVKGPTNSNLYPSGDSSSSSSINASTGTRTNPTSIIGNNLGTWGYATMPGAALDGNYFIGLTGTETQLFTKASASSSYGDDYSVLYAASVTPTTTPGAYTLAESSQGANDDSIVYYLTPNANCASYTIRYNDNGANSSTTMGITHNVVEDDEVTLAASNYQRSGYGFAGWSTVQLNPDSATFQSDLAAAVSAGKVFGPNETITANAALLAQATVENSTQYITMYAIWVKPATNTTYLQNWRGCDDLSTGNVIALIDQRDNQAYAVSKLADGECWMIENLRLEAANSSDATKAQGYGGVFAGLATSETTNFSDSATANSKYYSGTQSGTATINIGTDSSPQYRLPRYNNSNTNSTVSNMTAANANVYSYGNYYNWAAAKASTLLLSSEGSSDSANTSICPAGWKLPTGTGSGDFGKLSNSLGGYKNADNVAQNMNSSTTPTGAAMSNIFRRYPNNIIYSGYISNSTINGRGASGGYWSATSPNFGNSYLFYFDSYSNTQLQPGTVNLARFAGRSIRCLVNSGYTVSFNANGGSGTMSDQTMYAGEATALSANSFTAPTVGQSYQNAAGTTISGTAYTYWVFDGWTTNASGSGRRFTDEQSVTDLAAAGGNITLYAKWKGIETMKVNYQGNGLSYDDNSTVNTVYYYNDCSQGIIHKNSHTDNINDDGTQIGNTKYDNNLATKEVITISGATTLHATITYATEANWDYLYVFQGTYTGSVTRNMSAGQLATYNGNPNSPTTVTLDIPGDTATFAFYSDGSGQYYGYYVDIVGYDSNNNEVTGQVCTRTALYGEYKTPENTIHETFTGWSESSSATTPTYTTENKVLNKLSGNNGETKTLYAVHDNYYVITYVNTATSDTQTKTVKQGSSGTITPSTTWTRTNYSLAGWDTNSAGTNVVYTKGQSITPTADLIVYTVWKPAYTLVYDGNGADAGVMTNVKHTSVFEGDVFDLYASNYSKANYGFAGWSFDANAQPGGASRIYGPNEAITAPASSNPGETKTLYAVWVPAETGVYMQTWNGCGSLASGAVIALKDQRDNNVYTVGKLADGNCWMMENLRIDAAATNGSTNLGLQQGYAGAFTGLADSETANFSNSTTANTYNNETKYSTSNITDSNQGYRFPRYNNSNTASRNSSPSATDNRNAATSAHNNSLNSAIYSYGNYYTWAAALANTNDYTGPTATVDGKTSETAETSICPSGWQLPYGRTTGNGATSGGLYNLGVALNAASSTEASSRIWRSYPNNYVYSGYYTNSSASNRGSAIRLWTSTAASNINVYYASLSYSSVSAGNSLVNKHSGYSVRCVKINNTRTVTINAGNGVSSLSLSGWTGNGTGTLTKEVTLGDTIDLSALTVTRKTGYTGTDYVKVDNYGSLSGTTYTVGSGNGVITVNATGLNAPTCTVSSETAKVYNHVPITVTATSNASNYDTSSVDITYSFGWATAPILYSPLDNFSAAQTSNTYTVAKNLYHGSRYYGVKVTVTDKTNSSITNTCTSGAGANVLDPTATSNRTHVRFINASIDFNAGDGALSGTNPAYVAYEDSTYYTGINDSTTTSIPTVTPPTGYVFDGWYTLSSGGVKVINADGTNVVSVSGWTNNLGQWIITESTLAQATPKLYAQYTREACVVSAGKICYDDNGANSSTTMSLSGQTVGSSDTEVTLWASNFQRSGYGFAGWNTAADGSGTSYGPNETISNTTTLNSIKNSGLQLYAMWIQSAGNLQDWSGCSSLSQGAVTALTDRRDNQVYAVAKLADGKCWMIENLRLDNTGANNTDGSLAQGYASGFIGLADPEAVTNFSENTTANSLYSTSNITGDNQAFRFPRYNNSNTADTITTMTDPDQNVYSYGNYYNWAAATADIRDNTNMDDNNVENSICPAGWHLPMGGSKANEANNEFWGLIVEGINGNTLPGAYATSLFPQYTSMAEVDPLSKALRAFPNNFVASGSIASSGAFSARGSDGRYQSSTTTIGGNQEFGTTSNRFSFTTNNTESPRVNPGTNASYRYAGLAIRCVYGEPEIEETLYTKVVKQNKGKQTQAELQASITKSNSGVYLYDDTFGKASDQYNNFPVYYYRGILDNTTGTVGSNGDGAAYPNYVILDSNGGTHSTSDTCWRIVRTTGSGGVKMIYNGKWTGSTCANSGTAAQTTTSTTVYDGTTRNYTQAVRIGYTYNSTYAATGTTARTLATLFGSDSGYSGNTTSSAAKTEAETWFTNNINAYANILEPNAGYCNDRSVYNTSGTLQDETTVTTQQAATYGVTRLNFGAHVRNLTTSLSPSLRCTSSRSTVDIYSTSSASKGNKQLSKPVALLTADEASFAGSGSSTATQGSAYNTNSFLNTGANFVLLSPSYRNTNGRMYMFRLNASGYLANTYTSDSNGIRPVISLQAGSTPESGSGTATNPWVIRP